MVWSNSRLIRQQPICMMKQRVAFYSLVHENWGKLIWKSGRKVYKAKKQAKKNKKQKKE